MSRQKDGVKANIWDGFNPKAYLMQIVQFEDEKMHVDREPYERRLIPDTNDYTKTRSIWWNTQDFFKSLVI